MTYEINNLKTNSISKWMKEIKEICQKQKEKRLSESREEYDHVIKLT